MDRISPYLTTGKSTGVTTSLLAPPPSPSPLYPRSDIQASNVAGIHFRALWNTLQNVVESRSRVNSRGRLARLRGNTHSRSAGRLGPFNQVPRTFPGRRTCWNGLLVRFSIHPGFPADVPVFPSPD